MTTVEVPFSFIIALSAINGGAVAAIVGVVVFLALRVGRLPTRQEHNELRSEFKADNAQLRADMREDMAQLRADMAQLRADMREEMAQLRADMREEMAQLRADMAQLRADMREDMAQLREDFRRSHQQLMLALVNHSHREDGQAVFTAPPEMEITPAPADN